LDRIAVISDIHGNIPALEAVLDDIRSRQVNKIICIGDLVGKGPCPDVAIDIIREECETVLMGNWDDMVARTGNSELMNWARNKVGEERIDYLRENNILYKEEKFEHSYPFCWRCDTPLLYYPRDTWFIKMSSLREELVNNTNKANWYPDNIRTGRFGKFVENAIDWGLSRERY
jgi:Icc-related predicted phosphoesterase